MTRKDGRMQRMALMLGLVLATLVGAFAVAPAAQAQERPFERRFFADMRGDVAVIGNTLMRCATLPDTTAGQHETPTAAESANCALSLTNFPAPPVPWCDPQPSATMNGVCDGANNDSLAGTRRIDVDGTGGLVNGSRATLSLPASATVRKAFLYWSGVSNDFPGLPAQGRPETVSFPRPDELLRFQATVDPPGGGNDFRTVDADPARIGTIQAGTRNMYVGSADVTGIVQSAGNGAYDIGNVQLGEGQNRSGGWALYVIYDDPNTNFKNVTLFDGYQLISGDCPGTGCVTFPVTGFRTPPSGPVRTSLSIQGVDGDYQLAPNGLVVDGNPIFNQLNPSFNIMNSTITNNDAHVTSRNPADLQTNGYDLDVFDLTDVLDHDQESTQIVFGVDGQEPATLEALTFVTDLFVPNITNSKSVVGVTDLSPGDEIEYVITTGNAAGAEVDTATNFVLTDAIPANTTYVPGSATVDGSAGCALNGANLECVFDRMPPGTSHEIKFRVTVNAGVPTGTIISNTCSTAYDSVTFPNANLVTGCPTVEISVTGRPQDLTIDKSHTGQFVTGLAQSFNVVVSNVGGVPSSGTVTVTDTLPAGLTPVGASGAGWTCGVNGQDVNCARADSLPDGNSFPPITVNVDVGPSASGLITNVATVGGGGDTNAANNTDDDQVTIVQAYDVGVTKLVNPSTAFPGDEVTFTIFVTNHGPGASGAVTLQDTLPAGLMATEMTTNFGTCVVATLSCSFGSFSPPPANTATVTVKARVNAGTDNQTLTNIVRIDPGANDTNGNNHEASASVTVIGRPDMTIDKTHSPEPFVRGATGSFQLVARNSGTASTSGAVTVTDAIPAGLTIPLPGGVSGSGWDCTASIPTNVSCTRLDALGSNGTYPPITVNVAIAVDVPTQIVNTGVVGGGGEVNTTNNTDSDMVNLVDRFDVLVTKSVPLAADQELLPGEQGTFHIVVRNSGPSAAGAISVNDTLPPGLIFVSQSISFGSCDPATHDCTIPALNPGTQSEIDIVVQAPMIVLGSTETNVVSIDPGPNDTNANNHTAQATIRVLPVGRVDPLKQVVGRLVRGTNGSYRIVVRNTGGAPTTGTVTITDPIPAGLTLVSASGTGWTCAPPAATMSCTRNDPLPPGNAYPAINLVVAVSLTAPATITNVASATNCAAPTVCAPVCIAGAADCPPVIVEDDIDLSIEKVVSPTPEVRALSNVTWTLTIRNAGPSNANSVSVDDALPPNMTFVSAAIRAPATGTCTGPDCSFTGPIGPDETRIIDIVTTAQVVAPPTNPVQTNTATVTSANIAADRNRTNESDTATVTIVSPDLAMDKDITSRLVRGADATWDLTVTNIGTAFAQGPITVTDTLPTGLTYVSAVGAGWTCSNVLQVITCTRPGNIPAGQGVPVIVVTARVALNAPATLTNTACVQQPAGQPDPDPANNCKTPTPEQVFSEVDLQIDKTADPTSILATQETKFTLVVTNNGPSIAEDVTVQDTIDLASWVLTPAGAVVVGATAGQGCDAAPVAYDCTLGDLQPQQSETIEITVEAVNAKPPAETTVTNTATVASTTTELDPTNNTDTADVEVRRTNDLLTLKTSVTHPPIAGALATFEILVTNLGPSDALDSHVKDPLPPQFDASTVVATFTTGAGVCGLNLAGTAVECDIPSILAGEAALISVTGKLKSDTAGQMLTNTACVENIGDPETGNNCDPTPEEEIEARADIEVIKEGPAKAKADAEIVYDLLIRNNGPSDAPGTTMVDTIPEGTTFVDIDPDCPFVEATRTVTCDVGLLKPGDERTFKLTIDTKLEQADLTLTNDLAGSALPPDPKLENNQDKHDVVIEPASDIDVDKTAPLVVNAEQDLKYTITMSNKGPSPSPNTILEDKLPADMAFLSATTPQGSCSHANGVVTCNLGTLEKGQTVVVEVLVRPGKSLQNTTVKNKATVKGPNADPNIENNTDEHDILVKPPLPDLRVSKTLKSGTPRVGERLTYQVVVENIGHGPATNAVVTDTLPAGLTFISAQASAGSCSGRQVLTCHVGNLPPDAKATITLVVSVKSRGDQVNVATATSDEPDLNPLDNRAELRSKATAMIDPVIRKRSTARAVKRGESIPYTITFRNPGPGTLRNVSICDNPPSGLTYVPGSASPRATLRNGQICWKIKSLAAGRSKTFRLRGRADMDAPGTRLRNTVTATGPGMLTKRARASVPLGGVLGTRAEGVTG